jgi:hypothetical protein
MVQDAFDFSLIAITVALIVKAALCVVASHIDRENHGISTTKQVHFHDT